MDVFLFEKMIRYDRSTDSRPIVVIAGCTHNSGIEWFLEYISIRQLKRYIELDPESRELIPFKPEALDLLRKSIEQLDSLNDEKVKQSMCVCQ